MVALVGVVALWATNALAGPTAPPSTPTAAPATPTPPVGPTPTPPVGPTATPVPATPTPPVGPTATPAPATPTPAPTPTPGAGPLDKDQQKCVKAMNKAGSKVDKAQFKDNEKCLKDFQKGKLVGPVEDCLTADLKGKVQKAKAKTDKEDGKKCVPLMPQPAFGYTGAQTVNDAGVEGPIDLFHTIFGDPAADNVFLIGKANKDSAKCQTDMLKQGDKLEDVVLKELVKAKEDAIKLDTVNSSATLGAAIALQLSSSPKIAKQEDNFLKKVSKSCSSLQVAASMAFPGICADDDPAVLTDCVIAAARCVACVKMNEFDGLTMDCDLGDNNAADGSCPLP